MQLLIQARGQFQLYAPCECTVDARQVHRNAELVKGQVLEQAGTIGDVHLNADTVGFGRIVVRVEDE